MTAAKRLEARVLNMALSLLPGPTEVAAIKAAIEGQATRRAS